MEISVGLVFLCRSERTGPNWPYLDISKPRFGLISDLSELALTGMSEHIWTYLNPVSVSSFYADLSELALTGHI
jgi:hypothetical protein